MMKRGLVATPLARSCRLPYKVGKFFSQCTNNYMKIYRLESVVQDCRLGWCSEHTSEGLVWLIGAMMCLLAAPWVQLSISTGNGWPHNALRHHWLMPISWHFRDCKALLVTFWSSTACSLYKW